MLHKSEVEIGEEEVDTTRRRRAQACGGELSTKSISQNHSKVRGKYFSNMKK